MFRFTIRDVLWLMALVAIGLAWCVEHSRARELAKWRRAYDMLVAQISPDGYEARIVGDLLIVEFPDGITTQSEF
jgi:hypothetical protein